MKKKKLIDRNRHDRWLLADKYATYRILFTECEVPIEHHDSRRTNNCKVGPVARQFATNSALLSVDLTILLSVDLSDNLTVRV